MEERKGKKMNYIIFFKDKCQKNELEIDCQESDLKKKKKEHERIKSIKLTLKTFY